MLRNSNGAPLPMASVDAVQRFMDVWGELIVSLGDDYSCTLTCPEANAAADLYASAGETGIASQILEYHAEDCDYPEDHNEE